MAFFSLRIGSLIVRVKVKVSSVALWLLASLEGISQLVSQSVMFVKVLVEDSSFLGCSVTSQKIAVVCYTARKTLELANF